MDLTIATKNPGKIREIRDLLDIRGLVLHTFEDYPDWPDLLETGRTLDENAVQKAEALRDRFKRPALADDSGLLVAYLDGRPGVRSSRYAGPEEDPERNMDLLLRELDGVPPERRGARFSCVMAMALPGGEVHMTRGYCEGIILPERKGSGGFGYDPVFLPAGFDRSMAELSLEEKNAISHRGEALRQMRAVLEEIINRVNRGSGLES